MAEELMLPQDYDPRTRYARHDEVDRMRRAVTDTADLAQPPANLVATSPLMLNMPPLTPRMTIEAALAQVTTTTAPSAFHTDTIGTHY